jgi:toxin ParE1/3/4
VRQARFIAAARQEFLAEVAYYNEVQPGLGLRYTTAVEETAARALAFPLSGSPSVSNTRRVLIKGFSFSLFYRPEDDGSYNSGQIACSLHNHWMGLDNKFSF